MLGMILIIIAIVLAIVDAVMRGHPYVRPWLLHVAVIIGFVGVLLGVSPITTH